MTELPTPLPAPRDGVPSLHDLLHGATIRVMRADRASVGSLRDAAEVPFGDAAAATRVQPGGTAPATADDAAPTRIGRYPVRALLGRGGMGAVWEVWDEELGRPLAAKLASATVSRDREPLYKFLVEAQITGQLSHPGIVPVHELGITEDGRPYLVMKRVRGRDMSQLVAMLRSTPAGSPVVVPELAGEPSPLVGLLQTFQRVCEAVAFAHSHGVIHRDLKPANIMVGEFGEVLVVDWGLAKVLGQDPGSPDLERIVRPDPGTSRIARSGLGAAFRPQGTVDGAVVGTASYMSPEQAEGRTDALGPSSDIYALGAILYELLTLETPYPGRTVVEVLDALASGPPVPPRRRTPEREIPWELEAVVLRAMARTPVARYATAADLRLDIEAWLAGKPLAAARYGPLRRLAKWCARHRAVVATAATVGALAAALAVGVGWRERTLAAERARDQAIAIDARARAAEATAPPPPAADVDATHPAVQRWFAAQAERLAPLDELAVLGASAEGRHLGDGLERARTDARRQAICLEAARVAGTLGDVLVARLWIDRASLAALDEDARRAALARVEVDRSLRVRAGLDQARAILEGARERHGSQSHDHLATQLTRLGSLGPDLVRLLLAPVHLDSAHPRERRAAILALGMLGDTQTAGGDGRDPVLALVARFVALDCTADPETAVCLARALTELRDLRALDAWVEHPQRASLALSLAHRLSNVFGPLISLASARTEKSAMHTALVRHELGDEAGAIEHYGKHLALHPDDVRTLLRRGDLLRRRGSASTGESALASFDAAQADLDRAVELAPREVAPRFGRAMLALDRGRPDAALADLALALAIDSSHVRCLTVKGEALAQKGLTDEALAAFAVALQSSPQDVVTLGKRADLLGDLGRFDEAIADLTLALAVSPDDTTFLVNRSVLHVQKRDLDAALADVEAALAVDDRVVEAYLNRGSIRLERQQLDLARADFERAMELAPTNAMAWVQRGHVRRKSGDVAGAREDAAKALAVDPRAWRAHVLRSHLDAEEGRAEEAIADLTHALELGAPPPIRRERARLLEAHGRLDLAEQDVDALLAISPDDASLVAWRANLRAKADRFPAALTDYDRALELAPGKAMWHFERGLVKQHLEDVDGATADYTRAIELDPAFPYAYLQRGLMRQVRGDWARSLPDLDRCVELAPEAWNCWASRGRTLGELGRKSDALAALSRARALAPNDELRAHVDRLVERYSR